MGVDSEAKVLMERIDAHLKGCSQMSPSYRSLSEMQLYN